MAKPCLLLVPLLLLACGPSADPPAKAPQSARPAETAAVRFSGAGYGGPTQLMPFPAEGSQASRDANRRAREAASVADDEEFELHRCLPDRTLCARLVQEGESWHLDIAERGAGGAERRLRFTPAPQSTRSNRVAYHLWPHLVREQGGAVMIGLLAQRRIGYSGGGALATTLSLIRLAPGASAAVETLQLPLEGSALIDACASEQDMRLRLEECSDDYQFSGTLFLIPPRNGEGDRPEPKAQAGGGAGTESTPTFLFTTRARTYPGRAFGLTDQEQAARERRQFRRSELVWVEDPQCSYRRTFTFDRAAGGYRPDAPLPDCSDYLVAADPESGFF